MSVSAELDPVRLLKPPSNSIAELTFSLRTENPRVDAYWSAARAQRYQLVVADGTKTHKTKLIISPICRGAMRARRTGGEMVCEKSRPSGMMAVLATLASCVVKLSGAFASKRANWAFLVAGVLCIRGSGNSVNAALSTGWEGHEKSIKLFLFCALRFSDFGYLLA